MQSASALGRALLGRAAGGLGLGRRGGGPGAPGARRGMGSGPPGGFWADGQQKVVPGNLFAESPPKAGQARRLESWEAS